MIKVSHPAISSIHILNSFMICHQLFSRGKSSCDDVSVVESETKKGKVFESDLVESENVGITGLKNCRSTAEMPHSMVEKDALQAKSRIQSGRPRECQSGPLMPGTVLSSLSERARNLERYYNIHLIVSSILSMLRYVALEEFATLLGPEFFGAIKKCFEFREIPI